MLDAWPIKASNPMGQSAIFFVSKKVSDDSVTKSCGPARKGLRGGPARRGSRSHGPVARTTKGRIR